MNPVFVGGAPRSGTTLLQSVLCSTPATNPAVWEDNTLRHLVAGYEDGVRWFDLYTSAVFDSRADLRAYFRGLVVDYLARVKRRWPDAERLVIKLPRLAQFFPALSELVPEARFVIAVRDPRAIVASLMKVRERARGEPRRSAPAITAFVREFYGPAMDYFGRREHTQKAIWIRYEDLVADPHDIAHRLSVFTGIDLANYDPDAAWRGWDDGTVDIEKRRTTSYFSPLWGKGIEDSSLERWREVLSPGQAEDVLRGMSRYAVIFGYTDPLPATDRTGE